MDFGNLLSTMATLAVALLCLLMMSVWLRQGERTFEVEPGGEIDTRLRSQGFEEYPGPDAPDAPDTGQDEPASLLEELTVKQLLSLAQERGVEIPPKTNKAGIIALLEAAQGEEADENQPPTDQDEGGQE